MVPRATQAAGTTQIQKVVGALHGLLPKFGGPREGVRRLYAGVVRSIALYGAPVWSQRLPGVQRLRKKLNSVQRKIAIRVARLRGGYYSGSFSASGYIGGHGCETVYPDPRSLREECRRVKLVNWRKRLDEERNARQRTVGAILPNFEAWLGRKHGSVTFRLTQVLTGHGCFGEYLCRIGREMTPRCHHCEEDRDSAQHTLEECPTWESERCTLVGCIGRDLSPPAVIAAMLEDNQAWRTVVSFCETVMFKKEAAERVRERADPARRRRPDQSNQ
ncbi:uncharacterized protein [Maniola hyperantus]|uniref:uncharacterized protein n=1 Tax=Aphantopus hyperantus TaxID=2795564 RepID=UPI0015690CAA|nr:uncharacterized protein LOC117994891 [Maniola hyperantus]